MASRTHIVCLCEGEKGRSIDEVFINKLLKTLKPAWIRPEDKGSNVIRPQPSGSRGAVIKRMPGELKNCLSRGGDTTLMVWADCDHDCDDGESLKRKFWEEAKEQGITEEQFKSVVFIFAKDRLENWLEFLLTGNTDESQEGPKERKERAGREARDAAIKLAEMCSARMPIEDMPPSLQWSCRNWRALEKRMK